MKGKTRKPSQLKPLEKKTKATTRATHRKGVERPCKQGTGIPVLDPPKHIILPRGLKKHMGCLLHPFSLHFPCQTIILMLLEVASSMASWRKVLRLWHFGTFVTLEVAKSLFYLGQDLDILSWPSHHRVSTPHQHYHPEERKWELNHA